MGIEIIVGLPHLSAGALLARAKALQVPALISANCLSRWVQRDGCRDWQGWSLGPLANAIGLHSLDLDSAGYVAMSLYRGIPWTVATYVELAAAYPFRRVASLDYCVEAEITRDREEVLDRISRTIRVNRDCRQQFDDAGIGSRLMPVIQGRLPADYERCIDGLWPTLPPGTIVGVGSMCRRHVAGPEGLVAVFEHLDRVLPTGVRLHGFGVKGTALRFLRGLEHRIASIDSQAYGVAARRDAHRRGVSKTDALVAEHMERWTRCQRDRLHEAAPPLQHDLALPPPTTRLDRWHAAIATAQAEIRDLIECGELDHDALTATWIEQWAADLMPTLDTPPPIGPTHDATLEPSRNP
jgi:hypothetical protein